MVAATAEAPATGRKSRNKKAPAAAKPKRTVDEAHKRAMATGREEARTVRRYLEAIETTKPKRGRKVTVETLQVRLAKVVEELQTDLNPLQRLLLNQEKKDVQEQIAGFESGTTIDLTDLEAAFVKVGKAYADRKGIDRSTWKELGVSTEVLKAAGI